MHQVPQHLPSVLAAVAPVIQHYGYWAVGFFLLVEDFGVPVPGEAMLITAAFFAGAGQLNIILVILVGFAAAVIGDNIGFAIGTFGGRPLVERYGKYVLLTKERMDKAEDFFNRQGGKIIIIARFIEGLRQLNGIIAGTSEMRWHTFLGFNAIGAALWVTVWSLVGYYGGSHIATFQRYALYFSIAVGIIIVSYIVYLVWRARHRKHQHRA